MALIFYYNSEAKDLIEKNTKLLALSDDIYLINIDNLIKIVVNSLSPSYIEDILIAIPGYLSHQQSDPDLPLIKESGVNKSFTYNEVEFGNNNLNIIAGLNTVDTPENVGQVFSLLKNLKIYTARMGAYKPRTNPYSFQGHRKSCLNYVFDLADQYDMKALAIEVLSEQHADEILNEISINNRKCGVIFQIGTRNSQNYELLQYIGSHTEHPVLYKRGFGITLKESLSACEYLLRAGSQKIIFTFRGLKSYHADEHRNLCDFSQIPILQRDYNLITCADPSHSIGSKAKNNLGITDIANATAQAVISGVESLLIDIHPAPNKSLVDKKQALNFNEFNTLLSDIDICRKAYLTREKLYSTTKTIVAEKVVT